MYKKIPPAPPGLIWWEYLSDVPPLPEPEDYFNSTKYERYGWKYDDGFQVNDYSFSNLDLLSMSNISRGDGRLWVHLISVWVVSWWTWRLLWRYNEETVALRMEYLNSAPPGGQSHTVIVTEIPGIPYGTLPDRIEKTALRFLPAFIKHRLVKAAIKTMEAGDGAIGRVMGLAAKPILPDATVNYPDTQSATARAQPTSTHLPAGDFDSSTASVGPSNPAPHRAANPRPEARQEMGRAARQGKVVSELGAWPRAHRLLRSGVTMHDMVQREFEEIFPGEVESVHVVYITTALDQMVSEFSSVQRKLEDNLDLYLTLRRRGRDIKKRSTVTVVGLQYGEWGTRRYGNTPRQVDALQFYSARLEELMNHIKEEQAHILPPQPEHSLPAAFVTFRSRRSQVIASTTMLHHDQRSWMVEAAPEPREVIWANLGWRRWERNLRSTLCWVVFFLIVAFYVPVVAAIQGLIQVDRLVNVPVVREIVNLPLVQSVVAGLLPSLVLRIFLALLPYLLEGLALVEGSMSFSQVQFETVTKYFAFQVLTVFFTSLVAGSFLNQVQQFFANPTSIVRTLGAAAPQTAIFFMTYLLLLGLTTKPIAFLRLPQLAMYWVLDLLARSERAKNRVWKAQYMDYGYQTPDITIAILLGLVFCVIAPLITPIAFIFFIATSELFKYQLLYVYTPQFESGGQIWARVSDQILFSLLLFQIIMIGLMGIKGGLVQTLLLLPLPFINIFNWISSNALFRRPQQIHSLRAATDLDNRDKEQGLGEEIEGESNTGDLYQHPSFRIDERRVSNLIKAAHRVDMLLANRTNPSLADIEAEMGDLDVEGEDGGGPSTGAETPNPESDPQRWRSARDEEQARFLPASSRSLDDMEEGSSLRQALLPVSDRRV